MGHHKLSVSASAIASLEIKHNVAKNTKITHNLARNSSQSDRSGKVLSCWIESLARFLRSHKVSAVLIKK